MSRAHAPKNKFVCIPLFGGEGYISDAYPQVRLMPNTLPDGFLWRLLVVGSNNEDEQIWCRTYINDCAGCGGWLALQSGAAAQQQWYSGRYPYTHVPLSGVRFADATPIGAMSATVPPVELSRDAPEAQSAKLTETIAELTETVRHMREENKSMFQAMSQRADTDADAARANEETTNQRCQSTLRGGSVDVAHRSAPLPPKAPVARRTPTLRVARWIYP